MLQKEQKSPKLWPKSWLNVKWALFHGSFRSITAWFDYITIDDFPLATHFSPLNGPCHLSPYGENKHCQCFFFLPFWGRNSAPFPSWKGIYFSPNQEKNSPPIMFTFCHIARLLQTEQKSPKLWPESLLNVKWALFHGSFLLIAACFD